MRGYPVREVSRRLDVSTHSLFKWMKLFGEPAPKKPGVDHESEYRRLKRDLARVTENGLEQQFQASAPDQVWDETLFAVVSGTMVG